MSGNNISGPCLLSLDLWENLQRIEKRTVESLKRERDLPTFPQLGQLRWGMSPQRKSAPDGLPQQCFLYLDWAPL